MRIDFHTHSSASDGALEPAELLRRAAQRDVRGFAITDHDTVAGYLAVRDTTLAETVGLVSGVEFSCRWSGVTVHIVGLGMAVEHPSMCEGLQRLHAARQERGARIADRLERLGFAGALAGATAEAGSSQLGRPHFAAWMQESGHVKSFSEAFDRFLGQGKTGDVKAFWPELEEVTRWIVEGGGCAIIAHPLKYKLTRSKLRRMVADFQAAGGSAVELINGRQSADQTAQLRRLAHDFDLAVSVGSDFHRDNHFSPDLGVEWRTGPGLRTVWEDWSQSSSGNIAGDT